MNAMMRDVCTGKILTDKKMKGGNMTEKISHNDVVTDRHTYIGSSDIGVIMGVSPFKTPFELWCEKTQKIQPENLDEKDSVRMGKILEEFVAQEYAYRNNVSVRRAPKVYIHPEYPFLRAHADRLIQGTKKGLECKTTSEFNKNKWNGADIPESYILQCQWLMGLSGRKEWDIAVLIGGNKYKDKSLKFDKDLFDLMVEKAVTFWKENVLNDIPPELTPDDNSTLSKLYPDNNGNLLDLSDIDTDLLNSFEEAVAQRQELKMHEKQIKEELTEIENKIKNVIKENNGVKTLKYIVTWKTQKGQIEYNKEAMISDGVFHKYAVQNEHRALRVYANKESEVA